LKLWDWFKKLFHRQVNEESESLQERLEREEFDRDHVEPHLQTPKAIHQDVGRFMKHGHQAPWYRKSVKAKVQPEEEKD